MVVHDVKPFCSNDICVESDSASFWVTLAAGEDWDEAIDNITITRVTLREKQFGLLIARENVNLVITKNNSASVILNGTLPAPTSNNNLYYIPCFDKIIKYYYPDFVFGTNYPKTTEDYDNCGVDSLAMNVYSLSEVECRTNSDCSFNAKCIGIKCVLFKCKDNERYEDHSCVILNCLDNQFLEDHSCVDLKCKWYQNVDNHACVFDWYHARIYGILLAISIIIGLFSRIKIIRFFHKKN